MHDEYVPHKIEEKWQRHWKQTNLYHTDENEQKPKYYVLEQFPYPSGEGLHMGHVRVYSIGDVIARYRRMKGYSVLHPMGADAFGLPAENAAIQRGVSPRTWTLKNMEKIKTEQELLGVSYDWNRYVATCLPDYYQFNQWLFLLFYERGLAYRKKATVNWCPDCATVLANEQVESGRCWRCQSEVLKKELEQWFLKITDYAEQLLEGLDRLPRWPEKIKSMQRNWIGKSEGTHVFFPVAELENEQISVFTTRPDTLYGVTYLVLSPEHPLVLKLIRGKKNEKQIVEFIHELEKKSEIERTSTEVEKVGYPTGAFAIHPLTGKKIPIWVGNYVLMDYGTGAVMGVPAHDERDFSFAKKYQLPIQAVIQDPSSTQEDELTEAFTEEGVLIHSEQFSGLRSQEAKTLIAEHLEKKGMGGPTINYRLRDWLISRQRYWGTPIPIVYCDQCGTVPVSKDQLPVLLPEDVVFDGKRNPLTTSTSFVQTTCPNCGGQAKRETDTMDTFMDSSWYYMRYTDPQNKEMSFSPTSVNRWLPVDEYVGGIEHAVLHLLYARFVTKVLYDEGLLTIDEPFQSLLAQGMVIKDGQKMSKSKGNVVSPMEIIEKYGADTARLFILFAAPPERDLDWTDAGVEGSYRFINRVFRLVKQHQGLFQQKDNHPIDWNQESQELHRLLHSTIRKVTHEVGERNHFNTAISAIMELVNGITQLQKSASPQVLRESLEKLIILLAPFVPHVTEELWQQIGKTGSVHLQDWPSYDPDALVLDKIELAVQINGKLRTRIQISSTANKEEIEQQVLEHERVQAFTQGKEIRKVIVIPGKLVNVVVN